MPQKSLQDNYDFILCGAGTKYPFRGYISSIDPTVVGLGVLIGGSQNVYKRISQDIFVRPGLKRRGETDATLAGIVSSFDWTTSRGTFLPLRVVKDTATELSNLQVEVETNVAGVDTLVWYDLVVDQTNGRFVFDTWWDSTNLKDTLLYVNGGNTVGSWSGAVGVVTATTSNTIVLDADAVTLGFVDPTSSVMVNGTAYAFTGISGDTLTGVTPDPTGEANNSIALEIVVTNSPTELADFASDFIKVVANQLNVGSYTSQFIYVSSNEDFTDFAVVLPRAPGSPDQLVLGSLGKGITIQKGATDRSGNAVMAGGLGDWYTVIRSPITVGTDLTEQVDIIRTETADLSTAQAHEFIDLIGDTIVFLDQNNQLRQFGLVRNIVSPVLPLLSLDVFTELKNRDFTGGALRVVEDEGDTTVYITAPNEGIDYMYQVREQIDSIGNVQTERLWQPPQVRGISRISIISGVTYGYSATNPQMYQLWNTGQYYDDGPFIDEQLPYKCSMVFAYMNLGITQQMKFDKLYYEGHMTRGSTVYGKTYQEYQGSKNILTTTINKPIDPGKKLAAFFGAQTCPVPGENSLGDIEVGDGVLPPVVGDIPVPKFRAMRRVAVLDVFEAALEVYSEDVDSQWGLLRLGANLQASSELPTGIMDFRGRNLS